MDQAITDSEKLDAVVQRLWFPSIMPRRIQVDVIRRCLRALRAGRAGQEVFFQGGKFGLLDDHSEVMAFQIVIGDVFRVFAVGVHFLHLLSAGSVSRHVKSSLRLRKKASAKSPQSVSLPGASPSATHLLPPQRRGSVVPALRTLRSARVRLVPSEPACLDRKS